MLSTQPGNTLRKALKASHMLQIKVETKPWKIALPSRNIEIELTTVQSNYHVEMNPSDVGNQDRHIVQEVIKVEHWHFSGRAETIHPSHFSAHS